MNIKTENTEATNKEIEENKVTPKDGEETTIKKDEVTPEKKEEGENQPVKKSRSQRRIEKLARQNKELEERLKQLEEKIPTKDEPNPLDFEEIEDYQKALKEYTPKEDNRIKNLFADGETEYDDFAIKVSDKDLTITEPMLNEILQSDNDVEIAYYLADNKEKAKKIAMLPKRQMEKEILKIELGLEKATEPKTPVKKVSRAPEPITPVEGGGVTPKTLDDDDLSFEEYEKLANAKRKQNHGGFI